MKASFKNGVTKLQIFLSSGYPIWFFNKFLQRFLTVDNDLSDRGRGEIDPVVYLNSSVRRSLKRRGQELQKIWEQRSE